LSSAAETTIATIGTAVATRPAAAAVPVVAVIAQHRLDAGRRSHRRAQGRRRHRRRYNVGLRFAGFDIDSGSSGSTAGFDVVVVVVIALTVVVGVVVPDGHAALLMSEQCWTLLFLCAVATHCPSIRRPKCSQATVQRSNCGSGACHESFKTMVGTAWAIEGRADSPTRSSSPIHVSHDEY
jgi:hypothetical protein